MQDGGRCKVVQLEAIVLQKPSEEWMDWKSDASQQIGNKAYSSPLDGLGNFSACSPPSKEANPAQTGTRSAGGRNPWVRSFTSWPWDTEQFAQSPCLGPWEREEELGALAMLGWFPRASSKDSSIGGDGVG